MLTRIFRASLVGITVIAAALGSEFTSAPRTGAAAALTSAPSLGSGARFTYHGEAVETNPRVYVVFWGSKWHTQQAQSMMLAITAFYSAVGKSQLGALLTQYYDVINGKTIHVTQDVVLSGTAFAAGKPNGLIDATRYEQVAYATVRQMHWTLDSNTQVVVYSPPGSSPRLAGNPPQPLWVHGRLKLTTAAFGGIASPSFDTPQNTVGSSWEFAATVVNPYQYGGWFAQRANGGIANLPDWCVFKPAVQITRGDLILGQVWDLRYHRCGPRS